MRIQESLFEVNLQNFSMGFQESNLIKIEFTEFRLHYPLGNGYEIPRIPIFEVNTTFSAKLSRFF